MPNVISEFVCAGKKWIVVKWCLSLFDGRTHTHTWNFAFLIGLVIGAFPRCPFLSLFRCLWSSKIRRLASAAAAKILTRIIRLFQINQVLVFSIRWIKLNCITLWVVTKKKETLSRSPVKCWRNDRWSMLSAKKKKHTRQKGSSITSTHCVLTDFFVFSQWKTTLFWHSIAHLNR